MIDMLTYKPKKASPEEDALCKIILIYWVFVFFPANLLSFIVSENMT